MSIYLSASSISDFIKCPQKVKYRFEKTIPVIRSKEMIMGEVVHKVLESEWKDRDSAYKLLHSLGKKESLLKQDVYNMEFLIDMFFLNFKPILRDNDLIEYNFKIQLHDDVFIVGKMDRVSIDRGEIIDWKTGQTAVNLAYDVQCIIYYWAFEKEFGKKPVSINIASLKKGELVPYFRDEFFARELFDNIIPKMLLTVRREQYYKLGLFNHSCFRCPYKVGCLERESDVLDSPEFVE